MQTPRNAPIERIALDWWTRINPASKKGFLVALVVSVLAYGFEMTNLTLHHDDVLHLLVQAPVVGYYLGRFSYAGIFFYGLNGHFSPFLHMALGLTITALYGVVVSRLWGARSALEIGLVASVLCVFPYMAQIYQYNSAMVAFPLAHLFAALAVAFSLRATPASVILAALCYVGAFSTYQAVLSNAMTVLLFWLLSQVLFGRAREAGGLPTLIRPALAAAAAALVGGLVYVGIVASMHIPFDSAQGADRAFSLSSRLEGGLQLSQAIYQIAKGTQSALLWPEHYFPLFLKQLQLALIAGAAVTCAWLPTRLKTKGAILFLFAIALLAPRTLQLLHAGGSFHSLTMTSYALVVAGTTMIIMRAGWVTARSVAAVASMLLICGYVMQCNWISTINYLNTQAHFTTTTQILTRLRALPDQNWDGKTIAVVGHYDMPADFPFRPATGVASQFMAPNHMTMLARLMRDEATFVKADQSMPEVMEFAAARQPWPSPQSVGIVDGVGVVVLSKEK